MTAHVTYIMYWGGLYCEPAVIRTSTFTGQVGKQLNIVQE